MSSDDVRIRLAPQTASSERRLRTIRNARRRFVADLREPGPLRSAAITAAAASLKRDVGVCGDRARAAAGRAIDAALATTTQEPPR